MVNNWICRAGCVRLLSAIAESAFGKLSRLCLHEVSLLVLYNSIRETAAHRCCQLLYIACYQLMLEI
jgi:hypothetical protein